MLFNMTLPGAVAAKESFAFEYSGNYTDNRDENGIGTVRFNTSGTLTVTSGTATVSAYILAGGGGSSFRYGTAATYHAASGGGGGYQIVAVTLEAGTYEIVVGAGGTGNDTGPNSYAAGAGGDTSVFGYTCTGGGGGNASSTKPTAGSAGSPNGSAGSKQNKISTSNYQDIAGGSPNGGAVVNEAAQDGGDGYVELTFI